MSDVVQRAKVLLAEASAPPWRESRQVYGNSESILAPNAPSENVGTGFYEGMHLVCESVFRTGDRALIVQAPVIIAELVREVEELRKTFEFPDLERPNP